MLLIINRKLLLSTIRENLPLFQYVLGPTITPEFLLEALLSPGKAFCEVLDYDRVLIGIVLGYGVQNALFGSRLENILYDGMCILDTPPFAPQVHLCLDEASKETLLFLDNEENPDWKKGSKFQKPSAGFNSLQQEKRAIENRLVFSSERLVDESPNFVFACLKENQAFLRALEETQEKIRDLLQTPDWFEMTLEIVCGQKVVIEPVEKESNRLPNINLNRTIAKLLKQELLEKEYEDQYLSAFIEGLLETNNTSDSGREVLASPRAIRNIKLAKKNLGIADHFFNSLRKDTTCIPIMESFLYYKILENGCGPSLKNETEVCIDFEIFDLFGVSLNKAAAINLNLHETILSFAYGLQGMKKEEKRVIYIHPALEYGMHTYLEKVFI